MTRTEPKPVGKKDEHPLNAAIRAVLGELPKKGTPARKVYLKLLNRWTYSLTGEQQKYLCALIVSRGNGASAVLGADIVRRDAAANDIRRAVLYLGGQTYVRECIRLAFSFVRPTEADYYESMMACLTDDDGRVRLSATEALLDMDPETRPKDRGAASTRDLRRGLSKVLGFARDQGLLTPEGELARDDGDTGASAPIPPSRKTLGWRDGIPANGAAAAPEIDDDEQPDAAPGD